jgi:hypothetical protein
MCVCVCVRVCVCMCVCVLHKRRGDMCVICVRTRSVCEGKGKYICDKERCVGERQRSVWEGERR